jgi:hypothetical protein
LDFHRQCNIYSFDDIGGIVDHHCLCFLYIIGVLYSKPVQTCDRIKPVTDNGIPTLSLFIIGFPPAIQYLFGEKFKQMSRLTFSFNSYNQTVVELYSKPV